MKFHAFWDRQEICVWDFMLFMAFMRFLDEITRFLAVNGGEMNIEGCGRLIVHDGLLDVAWFCVYKLGGSLAGAECKLGGS